MENNLPKGWSRAILSDLVQYRKGKKPKKQQNCAFEGSVSYLDIRAIEKNVDETYADSDSSTLTDIDEIVVVWDGARSGWVGLSRKGALGSTLMGLKPKINKKYLYRFLQTQFDYLQANPRGTGIPHVDPDLFWNIEIPIAPIQEQVRIAVKIDALFEKIEANNKRLDRIPQILKRFRQSVLADAVSGKLVTQQSKWKEVELRSLVGRDGIFDGPFGSNLKTVDYVTEGVRVIRLENIENLSFINEKQTFITVEKYQLLLRHEVGEGDIIFSSFISDEIRACILPELKTKAIAKADCFCIRPDTTQVDKRFLLFSLVSGNSYNQLALGIHGATRPRINTTQLKSLLLSIPSLEEQKEIVSRVESLFSLINRIESRYQIIKASYSKISQSILLKAFRGELIAQDPNDEPAHVLLEKIKKEKDNVKSTKRAKRKS